MGELQRWACFSTPFFLTYENGALPLSTNFHNQPQIFCLRGDFNFNLTNTNPRVTKTSDVGNSALLFQG